MYKPSIKTNCCKQAVNATDLAAL